MVDLNNKTILVTGGSGFIGSNFIDLCLDTFQNLSIWNIDKLGEGPKRIHGYSETSAGKIYVPHNPFTKNSVNFVLGDLIYDIGENLAKVENLDYIFHFAAESHVDRSISGPAQFIENNVMSTTNLLDWAMKNHPKAKVVCISTDEVYGHLELDENPFTEDSQLAPRSPYAASKAASDLVALSYHSTYGLNVVVTRCCNNYGPHQHDEKFIPTILRKLFAGDKIPVYGTGRNIREWIHVDDHNRAVLELADIGAPGRVYNIGSGVEKTNLELIGDILTYIDLEGDLGIPIEFVEDRKGHDFRYAIDSVRWIRNFEPIPFKEGLRSTIDFYRNKYENEIHG